ncbi:hypothetical protein TIFTF001_002785 [Ficus carica]|uniref:Uncharacterized protein n=1 Tax=Ficus carica TaxID=3494 RepID=A0AA87Z6E2_FICCA|nr:hypothetical protein TIFTF001_002785 [Ficus carica]
MTNSSPRKTAALSSPVAAPPSASYPTPLPSDSSSFWASGLCFISSPCSAPPAIAAVPAMWWCGGTGVSEGRGRRR